MLIYLFCQNCSQEFPHDRQTGDWPEIKRNGAFGLIIHKQNSPASCHQHWGAFNKTYWSWATILWGTDTDVMVNSACWWTESAKCCFIVRSHSASLLWYTSLDHNCSQNCLILSTSLLEQFNYLYNSLWLLANKCFWDFLRCCLRYRSILP